MNTIEIKKLIEILGNHGGMEYHPFRHLIAKVRLTKKDEIIFRELLAALESENQEIIMDVSEIIGNIGDIRAIPRLKKILEREDLWGATSRSIAVALIKLGDETGIKFLKNKIIDTNAHRDLRIRGARALLKLKVKNLFEEDELVDTSGETMSSMSSIVLEKLIKKLKHK